MRIGVPLAFNCRFLVQRFHTLKFESDFFSRHGHWTLYWTGVYQSLLLKKQQRRSSFLFFLENGILLFFVVSLCWNKFLYIKYRLLEQKKETKQLRKNTCCLYIETKLVIFFSAVYIYLLTLKMSVLRRNNNVFCWADVCW